MAKRLVVTIAFLLMLPSRGWAAACAAGTLADYIAAGACTIGDKTYSDFTYAGTGFGGATAIPASGVAVVPQIIGGEIGVLFSAAWSVGPGQGLDSSIKYTVTAAPGNSIVDTVLSMSGFGHAADGVVAVSETMDNGASLFVHDDGGTVSSATVTFPSLSSIRTLNNISVTGGGAGIAAVSAVSNLFSQPGPTPTPTNTPSVGGPLCASDAMAAYIAPGFSCTIGDKTFSDFTYAGSGFGGATAIPASGVAVVPQVVGGEVGFLFSAAWTVGPGQGLDSSIGYTVTAAPGNSIVDAVLSMSGFGHTPGGVVAVSENLDNGARLFVHDDGGTVSSATVTFASVSSITTLKDISVNGNAGLATLSAVSNLFSQPPPTQTPTVTLTPTLTATPTQTPPATPTPTPLALGEACTSNTQCASTFCAPSGVCCNVPCTGPNQSCTLPDSVGICRAQPSVAPAASPRGLITLAVVLAALGVVSLRRIFTAGR